MKEICCAVMLMFLSLPLYAVELDGYEADSAGFKQIAQPYFQKHCVSCPVFRLQ